MSNLESRHKLTEFPALDAEEKSETLLVSLSKFMWWRKSGAQGLDPNASSDPEVLSLPSSSSESCLVNVEDAEAEKRKHDSAENLSVPNHPGLKRLSIPRASHLQRSDSSLSNRSNPSPEIIEGNVSPFEARTLPNVLRRISNLIAMGSNNPADIKKYWMPDSVSKECYDCAEKFTTFRRKHHCRICGQIFCSRCCNQEIPGKIIGYSGDLRVCTYCCKIVLSYLQSADLSTDLTDELRLVQEDLQNRFGGPSLDSLQSSTTHAYGSVSSIDHSLSYRSLPRRKASLVYQEERFATARSQESAFDPAPEEKQKTLGDWVSLKALWDDMCHPINGIDWTTQRYSTKKNIGNCVVGSELVDWLLSQRKITRREQGVQIGQMLLDVNLIESVSQVEPIFLDAYALYRPIQVPLPALAEVPESGLGSSPRSSSEFTSEQEFGGLDPLWVKQISGFGKSDEGGGVRDDMASPTTDGGDSLKPRLPSAASLYSLDLNTLENTVSISKPKEKDRVDPYSNNPPPAHAQVPSNKTKKGGTFSSVTTETMTDEFLKKTLSMSQRDNTTQNALTAATLVPPNGWQSPQQLTSDIEVMAFQQLCNSYIRHENDFLMQLLEKMNLDPSWVDIILPIVHKVTEIVKPDVRQADDDMDIRQYIQFKKLPGGKKEDCRIVNGIVCTKNVAHRGMRQMLKAPRILFIGSSIDYQRFENRFLSLEPLVMQEYDYLKNTVARISSMSPDLVLVEKTVARIAQEFMLDLGITLVINVKPSVMERAARSTQGVIESSADSPIGVPQLGICHNFYTETFQLLEGMKKTLMFFDGCAMHLGCTVLLRGGTNSELIRVKKIMSLMVFVAYNWRLERSFHIDLFSMPPAAAVLEPVPATSLEVSSAHGSTSSASVVTLDSKAPAEDTSTKSDVSPEEIILVPEDKSSSKSATKSSDPAAAVLDDPLHSFMNSSAPSEVSPPSQKNVKTGETPVPAKISQFQSNLSKVILSASPFIEYSLPYLETSAGMSCKLRRFLPEEIYWSSDLTSCENIRDDCDDNLNGATCTPNVPKIQWNKPHPLISVKLTSLNDEIQALVADFRRKGNTLNLTTKSSVSDKRTDQHQGVGRPQNQQNTSGNGRVDALDPFKHQKLSVLFCSFSPSSCNAPNFCVNPWVVNMDMYGRNDISLGMFLERYCFRKTYLCPARQCNTAMLQHVRRFGHEHGCVTVALKELESPILGSGENILMWNWCSICKTVSPIVPMSADAWSLSFAKYLELRFHGHKYKRRALENQNQCSHSLHFDHVHYFAQHNIIASFKYSAVRSWEVCLPIRVIKLEKEPKSVPQLIDEVKVVAITGHGVYSNILEALCSLKASGSRVEDVVNALLEHLNAERSVFRTKIEDIQMNLTSPNLQAGWEKPETDKFLWKITDSIGFLKSTISDTIQSWNIRLHDVILLRKKEEKQAKAHNQSQGSIKLETEHPPTENFQKPPVARVESDSMPIVHPKGGSTNTPSLLSSSRNSDDSSPRSDALAEVRHFESSLESRKDRTSLASGTGSGSTLDMSISGVLEELTKTPTQLSLLSSGLAPTSEATKDCVPTGVVLPPSVVQADAQSQLLTVEKIHKPSGEMVQHPEDSFEQKDRPEKKVSSSANAVKNIISHFLSTSAGGQVIQSPWLQVEHYFLASLTSIPIPVFEYEPSSVVAFALSSTEYKTKLVELIRTKSNPQLLDSANSKISDEQNSGTATPLKTNESSSEVYPSVSVNEKSSNPDPDNSPDVVQLDHSVEGTDDSSLEKKDVGNIEVQFNSSNAKFFCRVYFADRFRQLRKMCIAEDEAFYIRSISRCISWAVSGGKSGSTFCKTFDDRFVVKEMSKFEIHSFIDFAPNYFNYMRMCYQEKKPTVLAKIVGVYRIGFKNSQTNSDSKLDILIMENLFYQKRISQKFDLKGSMRNRLASTVGKDQEDLVLLDENLINMACDNPLYIRPHTKTVLTMSLQNDSRFLSKQKVMDYSLLVGLDEQNNELVVGIIDYIRTFTWDKKVEYWMKYSLGGQGKPTVISPEEYQTRFCDALDRYFLLVPDRWMGLGLGVDS